MIKKKIKLFFDTLGYQLNKKGHSELNDFKILAGLSRCRQRSIDIKTVIDVGASDGRWSDICMKEYPSAAYFLIEAQEPHREGLDNFKMKNSNVNYLISAAGGKEGEMFFDNSDLFGGLVVENDYGNDSLVKVPVTTIDIEVSKNNLQPPFLIKLDTHGYEVPILDGAEKTLKNANIVIIEVYNFVIAENSLRFWEICQHMDKLGFLPIDIVDVMHRIKDNSLWQFDIIFIKKERQEFLYNEYD